MLYITVMLYGRSGLRGEFKEYETKALELFRNHGGEVVVAYAPVKSDNQTEVPDEIQVLKIKDRVEFDKFMKNPDRVKMAGERDSVIRKTEVFFSEELISY